jgi:predicted ATP-binding protein involved in virulence
VNIKRLYVQDFRCIEEQEFVFHDSFTLILGDNGTGKTALLEALRIAAGCFLLPIKAVRPPNISKDDVREQIVPDDLGDVLRPPELKVYGPAIIRTAGVVDSQVAHWERRRKRESSQTMGATGQLEGIVVDLATRRTNGEAVTLPLLAFYHAQRATPHRHDSIQRSLPPHRWERGYEGALDARLDHDAQIRWISSLTYSELQQGQKSALLNAVQDALAQCLEGCRRLYYSVQLDELVAVDDYGRQRRARLLSEGYWGVLTLILDVAHRCASLNPHLGGRVLLETPGIILIDELDLHLHPRWQQRIVSDLCQVFPRMQFIATTHSPIIGASLKSDQLYHMELGDDGWCLGRKYEENTLGLSPNQMLTGSFFDLETDRPTEAQEQLNGLYDKIIEGDADAALRYLHILNEGAEVKVER